MVYAKAKKNKSAIKKKAEISKHGTALWKQTVMDMEGEN